MAVMMREFLATKLDTLRYEPTAKRLRVSAGGHLVADSTDALLVWEPKRLVPAYAVAEQDISVEAYLDRTDLARPANAADP